VSYGSLAAIPIDNGLVWVRPFYVTSTQTELPSLRFVIVNFEGTVAIRSTLNEALSAVFEQELPEEPSEGEEPTDPEEPEGTLEEQVAALLEEASDLFDEADAALEARDLGTYAEKTEEARSLIARAERLLSGSRGEEPSDPETTSTTERTSA
jgi:uncharacterized membrane protein (UPF0182 family)